MRRAVARGRVFPQSYSTDRRYGRLSLKACALFPLVWANADDQGRVCGDPEEIKYAVCPNIDHITKTDIPGLLEELATNSLIMVYDAPKSAAVQILDWWEVNQKMQWAWPSDYPPPEGWHDRLRYKGSATEVIKVNWDSQVSTQVSNGAGSGESSGELSGETHRISPLTTPFSENEKEIEKRRGNRRGNRNSPEDSGEEIASPSPTGSSTEIQILERLTACFTREWGRVPAHNPYEVIPRVPDARESAQLRDLARELSAAGGCPLDYINQAFREAAGQTKFHVSYVRKILHAWLDIGRGPP